MPASGSRELLQDQLLSEFREERGREFESFFRSQPRVETVTLNKTRAVGMTETMVTSVPLTHERVQASLNAIGLATPRPGMVLGATAKAHPLAFAVLGTALDEARAMGLRVDDWQMLQILSASLTHLDATLHRRPSFAPSEAAKR